MTGHITHVDVEKAVSDLKRRSLSGIEGEIGKLIYLASTRDYNTCEYHHEGLALRFGDDIATSALAACHEEIFSNLAVTSLEELLQDLEVYVDSTRSNRGEFLKAWSRLEPYRVAIPLGCDALAARLFLSNLKVAVAILEAGRSVASDCQSDA